MPPESGALALVDLVRRRALRRAGRRGSKILRRPRQGLPEFASGAQRPIGLAQKLAREQHKVGLTSADNLIGLGRRRDHPDRRGGDFRLTPNALRERNLISLPDRNLGALDIAA